MSFSEGRNYRLHRAVIARFQSGANSAEIADALRYRFAVSEALVAAIIAGETERKYAERRLLRCPS